MLVELRTLQLKIAAGPTVAASFAEALPARTALSPLAGFFATEVGTLNQVIQLWPYQNAAERESVLARAENLPQWPPEIDEQVIEEQVRLLEPLPFSPPLEPGEFGAIYEIRTYTYGVGFMPEVIERWAEKIPERRKLSPFIGAYRTTTGRRDQLVHVWAYQDAAERQRIRARAIETGAWPPNTHAEGMLLRQENILTIPAAFSPLR
ncbi:MULTISPECIES: NIPSNAP family protein [Streptacidiphilus]|uniref:NIPSNAP family protein n=1 Tax=Streptacidiphilus cavernicola TaxID=3342716 RepID=A0ABV6V0V2_9ACTN|nr:NIPSNAP family protein [Streptacidiphilus jeojiense]